MDNFLYYMKNQLGRHHLSVSTKMEYSTNLTLLVRYVEHFFKACLYFLHEIEQYRSVGLRERIECV